MRVYAEICGHTLAKAHARSGDAIAIGELSRRGRQLRPRDGVVRRDVRRPERARLRRAERRRRRRARHRGDGLTERWSGRLRSSRSRCSPSRRSRGGCPGTPVTPAMVFVAVGLLVGPEVLDELDLTSSSGDRANAGGGDAGVRALLRRLAHRPGAAPPRGRAAGAAARHRAAADDRARRPRGGGALRPADARGGRDPGGRARADRRGARAGGGHRAAHPGADPPGAERRERAQRRDLRAAAVRRRRGRRRRVRDLRRPQRRHAAARGDRLRDRRRGGRRARWWRRSSSTPAAAT